jgi:hypothetical protein
MGLKKIRLELARTPDFPEGSRNCGYEFTAPLDAEGMLDSKQWARDKAKCTVRRFWEHEDDQHGVLVHHVGKWAFAYPPGKDDAEEPIFRFDKHVFIPGEYVTVTEHDGVARPLRVVSVHPVAVSKAA